MARKTASRIAKRKEVEAAEAAPKKKATKKKATKKKAAKKTAKKRTSRAKKDVIERRRIVWVVLSSTMKEEGRYPYADLKSAEDRIATLKAKSPKKRFFIQRFKEPITESADADDE